MPKEPKIVQLIGNLNGNITGVLYDDGRVFIVEFKMAEDRKTAWQEWAQMKPPILPIPRPPKPERTGRRSRKSKN